jgi:hypothetical protein
MEKEPEIKAPSRPSAVETPSSKEMPKPRKAAEEQKTASTLSCWAEMRKDLPSYLDQSYTSLLRM